LPRGYRDQAAVDAVAVAIFYSRRARWRLAHAKAPSVVRWMWLQRQTTLPSTRNNAP
jgi:hypothetical protein